MLFWQGAVKSARGKDLNDKKTESRRDWLGRAPFSQIRSGPRGSVLIGSFRVNTRPTRRGADVRSNTTTDTLRVASGDLCSDAITRLANLHKHSLILRSH